MVESSSSVNEHSGNRVFISYSHNDKDFVRLLARDLKKEGIRLWLDEKEIMVGESIPEKVGEGIFKCDFFCLVISAHSVQSSWVKREYETAHYAFLTSGARPKIMPLLIEAVQLPNLLKDIKYADFTNGYYGGLVPLLNALNKYSPGPDVDEDELSPKVKIRSQDESFLSEVISLIEKHLSEPDFDIDMMRQQLFVSRATLFRRMRAITGKSPNKFLKSYRLERAAQLLRKNFGNVAEVAEAVGFEDPFYFSKSFKRRFGQPPKVYQRLHLEKRLIIKGS